MRDYVYVGDVARANLLAATAGDGRCYCVGTGVGTSVNEIYRLVSEAVGAGVAPRRAPRRAGDLRAAYFDCRAAQLELGWKPSVSLSEGIERTVEALRREALDASRFHLPIGESVGGEGAG